MAAALEGTVKANFCKWFIDQQLAEYTVLYAENEEGAWLDKIEERCVSSFLRSSYFSPSV